MYCNEKERLINVCSVTIVSAVRLRSLIQFANTENPTCK